jgi:hypothetical protein
MQKHRPRVQNKMIQNEHALLTDELERRLMLAAIDEQFRPQPLRAIGRGLRKLARSLRFSSKQARVHVA